MTLTQSITDLKGKLELSHHNKRFRTQVNRLMITGNSVKILINNSNRLTAVASVSQNKNRLIKDFVDFVR